MHFLEKCAKSIRHSHVLKDVELLWENVRPVYDKVLKAVAQSGLERVINGTDSIHVHPDLRNTVPEVYEPKVWAHLMNEMKPDDLVVDVGAYVGIYTVSIGRRLESDGKVIAFEPDPNNFYYLKKNTDLNSVKKR